MNIILLLLSIIVLAVILKFSLNLIIIVGILLLAYFVYTKYFAGKNTNNATEEEQSLEKKVIDSENQ